jgi:hypothetical protein
MIFTWPRATIMVTPPCVLWIKTSDSPSLMSLQCWINNLQRHLPNQVLPALPNKIHYCCSLCTCGYTAQYGGAIPNQFPTKNHRKSMRAGLTLPIKYPPRKGIKSNTQSGIDSGITLNLLTAVWEYSSVL